MNITELCYSADLSEVAYEVALEQLQVPPTAVVTLRVDKGNWFHAARITHSLSHLQGFEQVILVDDSYKEEEWSVTYLDNQIHSHGLT